MKDLYDDGLNGGVFVVLGAGQGIGKATVDRLSRAGARIVCVDRDPELAVLVAESCDGMAVSGDVTKREDMQRIFGTAAEWADGALNGIIDIVGVATIAPLGTMSDEAWATQMDIVLRHAFLTLQIAPQFMPAGGAITFVSSVSGTNYSPNQSVYGAAKAALNHLVRSGAVELGPQGIRVNAVAPGLVRTPRLDAAFPEMFWADAAQVFPLRRVVTPEDIAGTLVFLTSEASRCTTGVIIPVDAGMTLQVQRPRLPFKNNK